MRRPALIAVALGAVSALATGCGSSDKAPAGATVLHYRLTDAGCSPTKATAPAGPVEFDVDGGSSSVTELEVKDGDTILGEQENITDGLSGHFALTLDGGTYTVNCPNGSESDESTLVVTGGKAKPTSAGSTQAAERAADSYREYVERNTAVLVRKTTPFVAAVEAGNVAKAKGLYVAARIPYERVEPVAESFGNLDPEIDARANDVPKSKWGGFHKIEQALYAKGTTAGMAPVAKQLLANVEQLKEKAEGLKLRPAQIANGASELLNEVSTSKITGEEERYSHVDLDDFQANVDGSKAAFEAVKPLLDADAADAKLVATIGKQFANVDTDLSKYRRAAGFVAYTELTKPQVRQLAQAVDALAEPLSQVASKVA